MEKNFYSNSGIFLSDAMGNSYGMLKRSYLLSIRYPKGKPYLILNFARFARAKFNFIRGVSLGAGGCCVSMKVNNLKKMLDQFF